MPGLSRTLPRMALVAVLSVSFAVPSLVAQAVGVPVAASVAAPMEFDVISIKPNTSENGMRRIMNRPGMFIADNVSLKTLIQQAYGIREDLISGGAGWVGSSSFDFEGKISPADADTLKAMNNDQMKVARQQMMQHALADRFKLKIHTETKTMPVYELVLAKGGSKLKETDPNGNYPNGIKGPDGVARGGMMRVDRTKLDGQGITVSGLIGILSQNLERTVIDKTGLIGKYDFVLNWKADDEPGAQSNGAPDSNAPDLFTAIEEQLGLKLVSTKGPVEIIVIDNAEKPAEN
jgi:uncharacterized protein (TIGR03435 family)